MIRNITITLPRTQNNQLDISGAVVQANSTETADYCMFLNPLVAILNDIRLTEMGLKAKYIL